MRIKIGTASKERRRELGVALKINVMAQRSRKRGLGRSVLGMQPMTGCLFFLATLVAFFLGAFVTFGSNASFGGLKMKTPASQNKKVFPSSLLILTPIKDTNKRRQRRYVNNILSLSYPKERIRIGLLVGDSTDTASAKLVENTAKELRKHGYRSVRFFEASFGNNVLAEEKRHSRYEQGQRRKNIAIARNYLLFSSLMPDTEWVLWIDNDLLAYPSDLIHVLLSADKEIVVPVCLTIAGNRQYDLNSWRMKRIEDSTGLLEKKASENLELKGYDLDTGPDNRNILYLEELLGNVHDTEKRGNYTLARLDAVGGSVLLVNASLHRKGLIFPPFVFNGFIETEALSILAKRVHGIDSFGFVNYFVTHA